MWSLDGQLNIPYTGHGECSVFGKGSNIDGTAPLDGSMSSTHIHDLHVDTHLYGGIGDGVTGGVIEGNDHRVGVVDATRKHIQSDGEITNLCRLSRCAGGIGRWCCLILSVIDIWEDDGRCEETHESGAEEDGSTKPGLQVERLFETA